MTSFEKRVFVDIIKLLEIMLDLAWALNPITDVLLYTRKKRET